jgi:hypothetical protein
MDGPDVKKVLPMETAQRSAMRARRPQPRNSQPVAGPGKL